MFNVLFVLGMAGLGWVIPEFAAAIGPGKIRVPAMLNIITAVSMGCIGSYIAFA